MVKTASTLRPFRGFGGGPMHMNSQELIEQSFKDLLAKKSYQNVSVSEICDNAYISRKTFYNIFSCKEDIVASLFDKHAMKSLYAFHDLLSYEESLLLPDSSITRLYESIYKERDYYMRLVSAKIGSNEAFLKAVTTAIYEFDLKHIPTLTDLESEWALDYAAYFFASSQAMLLEKWILDGMKVSPKELAELYQRLTLPFWEGLMEGND